MIDTCSQAEIEVFVDDLTGHIAHVFVAHTAVIGTLGTGITLSRKAERPSVLIEKVLLLESKPEVGVVLRLGAHVRRMRLAVREHDLTENDITVLATGVRIERYGLEQTIRAFSFGLHGRAAVKAPGRQVSKSGGMIKCSDGSLAAQFGNGGLAIKPDIFEFIFGHSRSVTRSYK